MRMAKKHLLFEKRRWHAVTEEFSYETKPHRHHLERSEISIVTKM